MVRVLTVLLLIVGLSSAAYRPGPLVVGWQADGTYVVSTGQRILPGSIPFAARPADLALHPSGRLMAVTMASRVVLATPDGVIPGSAVTLDSPVSFRGCAWSPDGRTLYVSMSRGRLQRLSYDGRELRRADQIVLPRTEASKSGVPGGLCVTRDGSRLFVAMANLDAVAEIEPATARVTRMWPAQRIPFDVRLSGDENVLIISNWGGRAPRRGEESAESGPLRIVVDRRGVAASGTVTLNDRRTGRQRNLNVGLHPCGLAVQGDRAWVANAASDTISEIDLTAWRVSRTFNAFRMRNHRFGAMPNSLAVAGDRLFACSGGGNSLIELSLETGRIAGFRPAGFFPGGVCLSPDGATAYVVNLKGNGSVATVPGSAGHGVHSFQGTVSVVDLGADLDAATGRVMRLGGWTGRPPATPQLAVYAGAIKHVLYIIKENRTYDQVFGDMPNGNGAPRLCMFGEEVTPNHHALARSFALFDNAYCSGTNSAEGHQWALEALANDYIERFYSDYSRSYPFDGGDAMAYSAGGFLWDAAAKRGRSVRVYGEFCASSLARFEPQPRDWMEAWRDRQSGANRIKVTAGTTVAGLRRFLHPSVICWPLTMSDQWRADQFIADYSRLSSEDRVPSLMLLTLPSDHTSGTTPGFPRPRSMVADNDLALGRVIEAVSHSPQWKDTCIFVMEDDAQAGLDHVDGHRTVCLVVSPYVRRGVVDRTLYTQPSVVGSIGMMLGFGPLTRFDMLARPFERCFSDTPDLRPYAALRNRVPLDDMNPVLRTLQGSALHWARQSAALDWSDVDTADWRVLNRVLWHSFQGDAPYPE